VGPNNNSVVSRLTENLDGKARTRPKKVKRGTDVQVRGVLKRKEAASERAQHKENTEKTPVGLNQSVRGCK